MKDLDAIDWAIATIQSKIARPQPDPATGLMDCGCGEKVNVTTFHTALKQYYVKSSHVNTKLCDSKEEAIFMWNTAMGWEA